MDVITLRNNDGRVGFGGDPITVKSSKVGINPQLREHRFTYVFLQTHLLI